jgi:hypothetical protein
MNLNELIGKYYYDVNTGFISSEKLYKKMIEHNEKVSRKQIIEFLKNQETYQLNKTIKKKNHQYSTIQAKEILGSSQMDIMNFDRYEINHYKYILCFIDVYSRFAVCRAMTNRSMATIMESVESIFNEIGYPKNINTDQEFNKKPFNVLCDAHDITRFYSLGNEVNHNQLIERFNYTLSRKLKLFMQGNSDRNWPQKLNKIVSNYNNTVHSSIQVKPIDVWNNNGLKGIPIQKMKHFNNTFKIGDTVRTIIHKSQFDKNYVDKYSKTIHIINKIKGEKIYLDDVTREYYKPYELIIAGVAKPSKIEIEEPDEDFIMFDAEEIGKEHKTKMNKQLLKREDMNSDNILDPSEKRERKPVNRYQF